MATHGSRFLTEEDKQNYPKISMPLIRRIIALITPYAGQLVLALFCVAGTADF